MGTTCWYRLSNLVSGFGRAGQRRPPLKPRLRIELGTYSRNSRVGSLHLGRGLPIRTTPEQVSRAEQSIGCQRRPQNIRDHVAFFSEDAIDSNGKSLRSAYVAIATSSTLAISSSSLILEFLCCLDHGCS